MFASPSQCQRQLASLSSPLARVYRPLTPTELTPGSANEEKGTPTETTHVSVVRSDEPAETAPGNDKEEKAKFQKAKFHPDDPSDVIVVTPTMDGSETAMDSNASPSDSAQCVVSQAPAPESESQLSVITLVVSDESTVLGTVDTPSSSNLPEASLIKSGTNISEQSFQSKEKELSTSSRKKPSKSTKSHHSSHPSKSGAPQSSQQSTPKPKSNRSVKSFKKREDGTSRPSNHAKPSVDTTHSVRSQHPHHSVTSTQINGS